MRRSLTFTKNLALAAALLAVGIPFDPEEPCTKVVTRNGGEQYMFFFESVSTCGVYNTRELMNAWEDPEWHLNNPEHPFAYIKCAFQNREGLLDKVNQQIPLAIVERNGRYAIISANASEDLREKVYSQF